jgi:FkbM family methyltransferase
MLRLREMPFKSSEWQYRATQLQKLAARVLQQGGSPLSERQREAFLTRLHSKPVYLLGSTTQYARQFIRTASRLFSVRGVVDDVSREPAFDGVPRISGKDFVANGAGSIAVCLAFSHQGLNYFRELAEVAGAELVHYMEAVDAIRDFPRDHILGPLACGTASGIDRLLDAVSRFSDPLSVHTLLSILAGRLTYDRTWLESVNVGPETMYFGVDCVALSSSETLVDCGAFDGDTIRSYRHITQDTFESVIALEPDPYNFAALKEAYASDPRIELHPIAASRSVSQLTFAAGRGSFSSAEQYADATSAPEFVNVSTAPLDQIVTRKPTIIKIDVEGAESDVLEGARQIINAHRPKLTVAVYHKPLDIADLTDRIDAIAPGYRFYARHHGGFLLETVLYAIPDHAERNV